MLKGIPERRPASSTWIVGAIAIAAFVYAALHTVWMFGESFAFPGTEDDFETAFDRTWFAYYNVITTGMVLAGACIAVAVEYRWLHGHLRKLCWLLVLIGTVLLLIRAALGLLTTFTDPDIVLAALMWELWFLVVGILFALIARRNRRTTGV